MIKKPKFLTSIKGDKRGARTLSQIVLKKAEPEVSEETMSSLCGQCKGFCCEAFFFPVNKKQLLSKPEKLGSEKDQKFIKKNFIRVNPVFAPKTQFTMFAYSCRKWDKESGKCTAYKDRPEICKLFRCETVKKGILPTKRIEGGATPVA